MNKRMRQNLDFIFQRLIKRFVLTTYKFFELFIKQRTSQKKKGKNIIYSPISKFTPKSRMGDCSCLQIFSLLGWWGDTINFLRLTIINFRHVSCDLTCTTWTTCMTCKTNKSIEIYYCFSLPKKITLLSSGDRLLFRSVNFCLI
jgi:hypothetical protein